MGIVNQSASVRMRRRSDQGRTPRARQHIRNPRIYGRPPEFPQPKECEKESFRIYCIYDRFPSNWSAGYAGTPSRRRSRCRPQTCEATVSDRKRNIPSRVYLPISGPLYAPASNNMLCTDGSTPKQHRSPGFYGDSFSPIFRHRTGTAHGSRDLYGNVQNANWKICRTSPP